MTIRQHQMLVKLFLSVLLLGLAGCSSVKSQQDVHETASPSPTPIQITAVDLRKLRWIEGTWRGTGGGVPTFYERYKFENESMLAVETLADEKLTKVEDVSRFELKNGVFGYDLSGAGSFATALDDNSITFHPIKKGNSFRWQRESENSWKA